MLNKQKIEVSNIVNVSLALSLLLILFGFIIKQTFEVKIQYFVFILSCCVIAFVNIKTYNFPNVDKIIYLFLLISLSFISIPKVGFSSGFLFSLVSYFLVPLVFYGKSFSTFNINKLSIVFKIANIVFAFGLILQLLGVESKYLEKSFTYTFGELDFRLSSFAGGPLLLGLCGSLLIIYCLFEVKFRKEFKASNYILIFIGIFNIVVSQSRRYYFFIIITVVIMLLFQIKKNKKKQLLKKGIVFLVLTSIIFCLSIFYFQQNYFVDRFISSFDFKNDTSNSFKILMWLKAINDFINNFWLGTGLSSTTIVGKDIWSIVDSVEEIVTTESYFLKNFVEGGIFFGACWLYLLFKNLGIALKCFKNDNNSNQSLAGYFILFFFIDSFISTSLESMVSATLFWICLSILQEENKILIGK